MIIFLPVARYRVEFQVASGRPFSTFERLVLAAINGGSNGLDELVTIFAVHRRLLVEAVVTLMQAGWVSLGAKSHEFAPTAAGKAACREEKQLPPTIVLDNRVQSIVVEKVSGQIARNNEVDFYPKSKLRKLWAFGVPIPKGDVSNMVDPGMVAPLLLHDSTEWVRSIEKPYVISDNSAYIVAEVETRDNRITGLPKSWEAILAPELLERVRRREEELIQSRTTIDDSELKSLLKISRPAETAQTAQDEALWVPVSEGELDALTTSVDHFETLKHFLARATSYVSISSSTLAGSSIQKIVPLLEEGLRRDVLISVMWGAVNSNAAEHKVGLEYLKKLAYDSGKGENIGRLQVGGSPSGSSANILLADLPSGLAAVVGSYSWTASSAYSSAQHFSLFIRNPKLVARLCEVLRDVLSADEKLGTSSAIIRLEKAAEELRAAYQQDGASIEVAQARVLFDLEHKTAFQHAIFDATQSIYTSSRAMNLEAATGVLPQLLIATAMLGNQVKLRYGKNISPTPEQPHLEELLKSGASLAMLQDLEHNLLAVDNRLLISTSYPWLSVPISSRRPYAADIGVAVKGERVATLLPPEMFE